jgi:uncharacterized protein
MLELQRDLVAPGDWKLELVQITEGAAVQLDLRLESVMDGVLVTASLTAPITAECGRCLEPITESIEIAATELFAYEPDPEDEDLPVLDGDLIDLEPLLRDAVVLALPLNPVCDEACRGLCATCGIRLDDAEPDHSHEAPDPRWEALSALKEQKSQPSATMDVGSATSSSPAPPSNREK